MYNMEEIYYTFSAGPTIALTRQRTRSLIAKGIFLFATMSTLYNTLACSCCYRIREADR